MRTLASLRNFGDVIDQFIVRNHRLHICYQFETDFDTMLLLKEKMASTSLLTYERVKSSYISGDTRLSESWSKLAGDLRSALDYLVYFDERFDEAKPLRERCGKFLPLYFRFFFKCFGFKNRRIRNALRAVLMACERSLPLDRSIEDYVQKVGPDILLITPLIWFASGQVSYLRAAKKMNIPTVFGVESWDNLTTKGTLYELPDMVLVWNDLQAIEAEQLHHVPSNRLGITGAHTYDSWFGWNSRDRTDFCRELGFDPERPYICYTCSSKSIAAQELQLIEHWLKHLRMSDKRELAELQILIRPHPHNPQPWADAALSNDSNVRVWPPKGIIPLLRSDKDDYFNSLHHSVAVVGLNSSAQIEAGIIGRPVLTMINRDFPSAANQENTVHFHYLVREGLLIVGRDIQEHMEHLLKILRASDNPPDAHQTFIKRFVRPLDISRPAADAFVTKVEQLHAGYGKNQVRELKSNRILRALLLPVAILSRKFGGPFHGESRRHKMIEANLFTRK